MRGEHAALRGIPFTLCSLLFCNTRTCERARAVHRHRPGDPGSRPGKSPLARCIRLISSDFRVGDQPTSLQAIPSARFPAGGPGQPSTSHRFSAGPCDRGDGIILIALRYRCKMSYSWGFLSLGERERVRGTGRTLPQNPNPLPPLILPPILTHIPRISDPRSTLK